MHGTVHFAHIERHTRFTVFAKPTIWSCKQQQVKPRVPQIANALLVVVMANCAQVISLGRCALNTTPISSDGMMRASMLEGVRRGASCALWCCAHFQCTVTKPRVGQQEIRAEPQ